MEASQRKTRLIKPEEVNKHLDMLNLAFAPWGSRQEWENKYVQPDFKITENVIVVEEDGKWVGAGTAWFRDALINENKIKIYMPGNLFTHPDHTGKGIYSTAMKALNQLGQENGAVFGITFPSPLALPFRALPGYGFCDVVRPKTKIKLLKPEAMLLLLEDEKIGILQKLEGKRVAVIIKGEKTLFEIKDSSLRKTTELGQVDITIKSELKTLFNIFAGSRQSKSKLVSSTFGAMLRGRLSVRISIKDLARVLVS